jgi:prepilin-type N-terminal cleavage/methylation domain-containing protein
MIEPRHSFTLIELLVVIAIVGILAGIIIVSMTNATDSATIAKAKVFANSMRDSMANNIVSEWKFDGSGIADGSTATTDYIKDTWGSGGGAFSSEPLVKSGSNCVYGSCLNFDGVDDYVSIANNSSFDISNKITLSIWIKPNWTGIINSDSYPVYKNASWRIWDQYGTRTYSFGLYVDGNWRNTASIILDQSKWSFLSATYDNSIKKLSFYLNGDLKKEIVLSGLNTYDIGINTNAIIIGRFLGGKQTDIDELRIYNVAISSSQIKQQYFADLQKLYASKGIDKQEYQERLAELNNYCFVNK